MNAYEVLECKPDFTADQLKHQYFRLLQKYHPDKNPSYENNNNNVRNSETKNSKFLQIKAAYDLLRDRKRRFEYDSILKQQILENCYFAQCQQRFSISKDFTLKKSANIYVMHCICGGQFSFSTSDYDSLILTHSLESLSTHYLTLPCDTCSTAVDVSMN